MKRQLVYDIPIRLFHWLFTGLFVSAFLIAKNVDDESVVFSYHMLAGLLLAFIVVLRLAWGITGTKHSRFAAFALNPKDLLAYFFGILSGDKKKWSGHNPASSWAAIGMFVCALGLALTGYLMANGQEESLEEVHELLANGFLILAILHVGGVFLHTIRYQDAIALSMINGTKSDVPDSEKITNPRMGIGFLFLSLVAAFTFFLVRNFDSQKQTLNLFGTSLQLGEGGEMENSETEEEMYENEDD